MQLHAEDVSLAELDDLALLHGQSDDLLLRQSQWPVLFHRDLHLLFLRRQQCPCRVL
jgi:hypothetical protein